MAEQHVQIFKALGLPDEKIAEIEGVTADKLTEFKADGYLTEIDGITRTKLANDATFLEGLDATKLPQKLTKAIESGIYGRFMNEVKEVAAKEWGVDVKTALTPDQEKSLKGAFKTLRDASIKDKPEAMKELQNQLAEALQGKETTTTELTKKMEEAVAAEKGNTTGVLQRMASLTTIGTIKGIVGPSKFYIVPALEAAKAKYTVTVDPNTFDVTLMQKDNPSLKALDSKGQPIKFVDVVTEYLKGEGAIDPKKAEAESQDKKDPYSFRVEADKIVMPDYIAKAVQKNIDEEKAKK